jgi:hypothetical protein
MRSRATFSRNRVPLDPIEVVAELSSAEASVGPLRQTLARFRTDDAEIAPADAWHLRLEALIGEFDWAVFEVRPRSAGLGVPLTKKKQLAELAMTVKTRAGFDADRRAIIPHIDAL